GAVFEAARNARLACRDGSPGREPGGAGRSADCGRPAPGPLLLLRRLVAVEDVGYRAPRPVGLTAVYHDVLPRVLDRRPAGRRNGERVTAPAIGQIAGARDGRGVDLDAGEARVDQGLEEALDLRAALDDRVIGRHQHGVRRVEGLDQARRTLGAGRLHELRIELVDRVGGARQLGRGRLRRLLRGLL